MTDAQKRATAKYRATHTKRLAYDIPTETAARWQNSAQAAGESMRAYIIGAVESRIAREAGTPPAMAGTAQADVSGDGPAASTATDASDRPPDSSGG